VGVEIAGAFEGVIAEALFDAIADATASRVRGAGLLR
jgi:hypothetical protein